VDNQTEAGAAALGVLDAMNNRDLERIRDLVTDDFVDHGIPPGIVPPGPDGYIATLRWVTETLGVTYALDEMVAVGDDVMIRATAHAVHSTDHLGLPATGKPYAMSTMHWYKARGGKLCEHWGVRDEWGVLVQVGALVPQFPDLGFADLQVANG
jgi:predicted ester cyclase